MDDRDRDRRAQPAPRRARTDLSWPANSLLGGLDRPARDRLLTLGALAQYPADRIVIREAERTTYVLILLDGVVKATGRAQDGRDALLAVRMGGDLVGELAAMDGQARSATVTTCSAVTARVITQAEFLDCTRREPAIARAVNSAVVTKLRVANTRRIDFAGSDALTRIARVLHQLAVAYGEPDSGNSVINWPLTQPELATLAGAAEPTAHKALRQLRADGVVSTGYRSITITDLAQLQKIAYPDEPVPGSGR